MIDLVCDSGSPVDCDSSCAPCCVVCVLCLVDCTLRQPYSSLFLCDNDDDVCLSVMSSYARSCLASGEGVVEGSGISALQIFFNKFLNALPACIAAHEQNAGCVALTKLLSEDLECIRDAEVYEAEIEATGPVYFFPPLGSLLLLLSKNGGTPLVKHIDSAMCHPWRR